MTILVPGATVGQSSCNHHNHERPHYWPQQQGVESLVQMCARDETANWLPSITFQHASKARRSQEKEEEEEYLEVSKCMRSFQSRDYAL